MTIAISLPWTIQDLELVITAVQEKTAAMATALALEGHPDEVADQIGYKDRTDRHERYTSLLDQLRAFTGKPGIYVYVPHPPEKFREAGFEWPMILDAIDRPKLHWWPAVGGDFQDTELPLPDDVGLWLWCDWGSSWCGSSELGGDDAGPCWQGTWRRLTPEERERINEGKALWTTSGGTP